MSHFYGLLKSAAKHVVSRRGHKTTGITATAASWRGAVQVHVYYDEETGKDRFVVSQEIWHGQGVSEIIARGEIGELKLG